MDLAENMHCHLNSSGSNHTQGLVTTSASHPIKRSKLVTGCLAEQVSIVLAVSLCNTCQFGLSLCKSVTSEVILLCNLVCVKTCKHSYLSSGVLLTSEI
jgi:hypothetical protein